MFQALLQINLLQKHRCTVVVGPNAVLPFTTHGTSASAGPQYTIKGL